ncbi:MAG: 4Fe-4S dicluster domain-containing protein [Chloroflexi bacterium]|nr:4Fe-4S dicluster domain-containing protein [Chloroflexota bacterium]
MKRVYPREDFCIGCRLCEIHCLVQHSRSKDIIKAFKKEFPRAAKRIGVQENGATSFALQCRHCEEPMCVYSCLTGAMYRDPATGAIRHDAGKCVGCWTCIMVCPYGAISRDPEGRKIIAKCDLCPGLDTPACVANCPNEALVCVEEAG